MPDRRAALRQNRSRGSSGDAAALRGLPRHRPRAAAPGLTSDRGPRHSVPAMTATVVRGRTVAELAAAVGVPPDTVRYYERAGLLPPPRRTPAGYRSYDDGAVDRMRFIQGAQRLGLRLADVRSLLEIRDTGRCPCEPAGEL